MNFRNVAVVGAGLMGHGIALTLARAGCRVTVVDPDSASLETIHGRISQSMRAMGIDDGTIAVTLGLVHPVRDLGQAVADADIVFEAAPEKLELKQQIFSEIESHAPESCILASNTSVMPITQIMAPLGLKARALGTHWWNPPHIIPLVEVIRTEWTDDTSMNAVMEFLVAAGKTPVRVEKDVPGFIGNRMQHAMWREAINLVEREICSAEAVDTVVKSCFGRRLAVLGPLENADLVGTDLTLDIHTQVMHDLDGRNAPSPYLESLVASGKLGMKSGEGFRKWSESEAQETRDRVADHLIKLDAILGP